MNRLIIGLFAGMLLGASQALAVGDVAWRKLAYLHELKGDAAGVLRTELNLSRVDVGNIAPLKLSWSAAPGCVYTATFNGKAYPVSAVDGTCSFQVPNGGFRRDHNQVALGLASGSDAALTNADRVAVFGTVEAAPGPRLKRKDFFERHLDRRIPAFAEAARLSAAGDAAGAVRTFAGYVRTHLDIPAYVKERYRNPPPSERGRIKFIANRVLGGTMEECGVYHRFPEGRIVWQFNPTWNGYIEWVWHLSVLRFLDEMMRQYVLDGNEAYAQAWARYFLDFVHDEPCPEKGSGFATSSWRSLETASRLHEYLVNDVYWLLKSPVMTDDLIVTAFTSFWEHGNRLRHGHAHGGNWFGNEMTSLYCFTLLVPYFEESDEWRAYALAMVERELVEQVYPDGQQVELSTGYHPGMISIFGRVPRTCAHLGVKPPANVHAILARMYEPYMAIMRPDRRIPALNDASIWSSQAFFERGLRDFPERTDFAWFAGRKGAEPPTWTSRALPYTGWVALRSSWDADAVWGFMDCGPYGTGHQHEDKLNVLVCGYGRELVNEGGWYDYDTSENRKYILSTRSHNTVRFDGGDQATGTVYRWHPKTDCKKKADLLFVTNAVADWAEATFAGPYYGASGKNLSHRRRLILVKRAQDLPPFLVVVDRFTSTDAKPHAYEQLWHLRGGEFTSFTPNAFLADYGEGVMLAGAHSDATAKFVDKRGQTKPELQGWDPGRWDKHNAKPIATPVVCGSFTGARRVVTVLQPLRASDRTPRIVAVDASKDITGSSFVLYLQNGRAVLLDE